MDDRAEGGNLVRFGELTFGEIADAASAGALVVIPTGCTEQQGPHLPVDFDTWMVSAVAEAAARRAHDRHGARVLVLPALPLGRRLSTAALGAATSTSASDCTRRQ